MNKKTRQRRQVRIRAKVQGSKSRPRVNVHRSNRYLLVQVINDDLGSTLVSIRGTDSKKVGQDLVAKLKEEKVKKVVFDRGGYAYHGRVKELAETLRAEGLEL